MLAFQVLGMSVHRHARTWGLDQSVEAYKQHAYRGMVTSLPIRGSRLGILLPWPQETVSPAGRQSVNISENMMSYIRDVVCADGLKRFTPRLDDPSC